MLVGIDGAPFDLVSRWADDGTLPNIASFIRRGSFGALEAPVPDTPPSWSSIYTGKNAGKHGVYDFVKPKVGSSRQELVNSTSRDSRDIWEIIGAQGLKVGVLNAPLTYPPRQVHGVLVTGFLTPDGARDYTYPNGLGRELEESVPGFHPSRISQLNVGTEARRKSYKREALATISNVGAAAKYLLAKGGFDFFAVIFSETDHLQHVFWDDYDEGVPSGGSTRSRFGEPVKDAYRMVDRTVGELVAQVGEGWYTVIVSDHGACRLRRYFHPNNLLKQAGMISFRGSLVTKARKALLRSGFGEELYLFLSRLGLVRPAVLIRPFMLSLSDVDFRGTRAYSIGGGSGLGRIYLNPRGGEGADEASMGDYERQRSSLISKLASLSDPEGSSSPITRIYRREELFHGPHLPEAPDILFLMQDGYEAFPHKSFGLSNFTPNPNSFRSGTHTNKGIVAISGDVVKVGPLGGASVMDIAPTILHLMGLPVPSDMDGHVLSEALEKEFVERSPVEYTRPSDTGQSAHRLTAEEEAKIEDNLKALGYI